MKIDSETNFIIPFYDFPLAVLSVYLNFLSSTTLGVQKCCQFHIYLIIVFANIFINVFTINYS
jgi:hypothetical protein